MTEHLLENLRAYMLQGNVEVLAYILPFAHNAKQVVRKVGRVGIMQPYPFHSFNVGYPFDQFGYTLLLVEVNTVECEFLSYNLELLHAF